MLRPKVLLAAAVVLMLATLQTGTGVAQQGLQIRTVLQTTTYWSGQPILFPLFRNQMTGLVFEIAPGGRVGRHMHPVPVFVYILEGEGTFEGDGHVHKVYRPGEAFVDGGAWHDLFNRGTVPLRALAVFAGEEGTPLTVRPAGAAGPQGLQIRTVLQTMT
jgi:quercetin dioxygenase-like cupin family protein